MNTAHPDDRHAFSSVNNCRIVDLPRRLGDNGCLTEAENTGEYPFDIRRVYYIYDVPADSQRGGHSHRALQSLLVAVSGSFEVTLDDGSARRTFRLDRPYQALYIEGGIWRQLSNFSAGAVCLVLASLPYDEDDYVRDYDEFMRLTAAKRATAQAEPAIKYPALDLAVVNAPYAQALKEAACRVIDSGHYIGGPEVQGLESELAELCQAPHAIAVSNGLDALRLILRGYIELGRLRPGDEVIVPADTYIASVLAITDCGLNPVLADPDMTTYNLDTSALEKLVTPRTRAVMVVHLYGQVCWDQALVDLANRHGLLIVEDCAQALGARASMPGLFGSSMAGALGHAAGISFYPTKNVGALGDAGAVITHDAELAAAVSALRNYGTDRQYHNIMAGLNCRMDPIQAAMLRVKLPHINAENEHRRRIAAIYDRHITNPMVVKPEHPEFAPSHVWHQYVVRVQDRDAFRQRLLEQGVGTGIHYPIAPHQQPCYPQFHDLDLPAATVIAAQVVSLPMHSGLSEADAMAIAQAVNRY